MTEIQGDGAPFGVSGHHFTGDRVEGQGQGSYRLGPNIVLGRRGPVVRARREHGSEVVTVWQWTFESESDGPVGRSSVELRFLRGAANLVSLRHANLLRVTDFGCTPDYGFLVTEPWPEDTLESVLEAQGPCNVADAAQLGIEIAEGLAHLHRRGLAHGALTAPRVGLRDDEGGVTRAVLLDYEVFGATEEAQRADAHALAKLLRDMTVGDDPRRVMPLALDDLVQRLEANVATADEAAEALREWLLATPYSVGRSRSSSRGRLPALGGHTFSVAPVSRARSDWWWVIGSVVVALGSLIAVGIGAVQIIESLWTGSREAVGVEVRRFELVEGVVVVDGVGVSPSQIERVLAFVNEASAADLRDAGIHARGIEQILAERPFVSIRAFADTREVGRQTIRAAVLATEP